MKVSEVIINKVFTGSGNLKAFATIIFALKDDGDGCLKISGWKVLQNRNGDLYVSNPQEKDPKEDKWWDRVYINVENEDGKALREEIQSSTLRAYNAASSRSEKSSSSSKPKAKAPF